VGQKAEELGEDCGGEVGGKGVGLPNALGERSKQLLAPRPSRPDRRCDFFENINKVKTVLLSER